MHRKPLVLLGALPKPLFRHKAASCNRPGIVFSKWLPVGSVFENVSFTLLHFWCFYLNILHPKFIDWSIWQRSVCKAIMICHLVQDVFCCCSITVVAIYHGERKKTVDIHSLWSSCRPAKTASVALFSRLVTVVTVWRSFSSDFRCRLRTEQTTSTGNGWQTFFANVLSSRC